MYPNRLRRSARKPVRRRAQPVRRVTRRRGAKTDSFGDAVGFTDKDRLQKTVFPPCLERNLRVAFQTTNSGVTSGATNLILGNSANDPGQSLAAKQPAFYDIFKQMYSYYTVKSFDYRITCLSCGAGATSIPAWFAAIPNTATTLPSYTLDDVTAYPDSKVALLQSSVANVTPAMNQVCLVGHVDCVKLLGYHDVFNLCDVNAALTTEDPIDCAYLLLRVSPLDGSTATTFKFLIELNLHVKFEGPLQVTDSVNLAKPYPYPSASLDRESKDDTVEVSRNLSTPVPSRRSSPVRR